MTPQEGVEAINAELRRVGKECGRNLLITVVMVTPGGPDGGASMTMASNAKSPDMVSSMLGLAKQRADEEARAAAIVVPDSRIVVPE